MTLGTPKGFNTYRNYGWMYQRLMNGKTINEIAGICKCSEDTIWNWAKELEIVYKCIECGQLLKIKDGKFRTKRCLDCQRKYQKQCQKQYQKQYFKQWWAKNRPNDKFVVIVGNFNKSIVSYLCWNKEMRSYKEKCCGGSWDKLKVDFYGLLMFFSLMLQYNEKCKLFAKKIELKEKQREKKWRLIKIKREKLKQYCENNGKDYNKEWWNRYMNKRYKSDLKFQLSRKMATAIDASLKKGSKKRRHWEILVDYTLKKLKKSLQKTIPKGYTWQDFLEGKLHIDHIIPKSIFNFTEPEHIDFKRCWALDNLRLLPSKENHIKWSKLKKPFQPCLKLTF